MNKKVFLLTKQVDIYLCVYMCNSDFKLKKNIQHSTSVRSASMIQQSWIKNIWKKYQIKQKHKFSKYNITTLHSNCFFFNSTQIFLQYNLHTHIHKSWVFSQIDSIKWTPSDPDIAISNTTENSLVPPSITTTTKITTVLIFIEMNWSYLFCSVYEMTWYRVDSLLLYFMF